MLYNLFSTVVITIIILLQSANFLKFAHQQYLPTPFRMLLAMIYGDDDHYCINDKNVEKAEMACARMSMN